MIMTKEEYDKKANELKKLCDDIVNNVIDSKIIEKNEIHQINDKRFQYYSVIYWYDVIFKEDYYKEYNGKIISGFHIMPFQITKDVIMNAKKKDTEIFNKAKKNYIDFDCKTYNFHKFPDNNYQIVLIDHEWSKQSNHHNGPGRPIRLKDDSYFDNNIDKLIDEIEKSEMYFPNISDNRNIKNSNELRKLVKEVIDKLKI